MSRSLLVVIAAVAIAGCSSTSPESGSSSGSAASTGTSGSGGSSSTSGSTSSTGTSGSSSSSGSSSAQAGGTLSPAYFTPATAVGSFGGGGTMVDKSRAIVRMFPDDRACAQVVGNDAGAVAEVDVELTGIPVGPGVYPASETGVNDAGRGAGVFYQFPLPDGGASFGLYRSVGGSVTVTTASTADGFAGSFNVALTSETSGGDAGSLSGTFTAPYCQLTY